MIRTALFLTDSGQAVYDEKKMAYDSLMASLESSKAKLEHEVRALREDVSTKESRFHYLQMMMAMMNTHVCSTCIGACCPTYPVQMDRVQAEMLNYVSKDPNKKRSHRDIYTKKIQEQEVLGKSLRDKQKLLKDTQEPTLRQVDMWRDLIKLFECKRALATNETKEASGAEQDRMVF